MTREDLIVDAIALVDRAEYSLPWIAAAPIVVGFRKNGALSLFFGEEEVYHFRSDGRLRRGFWHGKLLKAEQGKLVELTRSRRPSETVLAREDLADDRQADHLARLASRLRQLTESLNDGPPAIVREVAATPGGATRRLRDWLARFAAQPIQIADSSRVC